MAVRGRRGRRAGTAGAAAWVAAALLVAASGAWAEGTITPGVVDFGEQPLGTQSESRPVELVNLGPRPFLVNRGELNTGPDNIDFVATRDGCTGVTLAPGERCGVDLAFKPTAAGATSQTFGFDVSGPDYKTLAERVAVVTLNGIGTGTLPPVRAAPAPLPEGFFIPVIGMVALGLGLFILAATRRGAAAG